MSPMPTTGTARPRWKGCLTRGLYLTAAAAVLFLLGAGTVYFLSNRALAEEIKAMTSALESAQDELGRLRPLVADNEQLQAEAEQAGLQGLAFQALVQVNDARVAMALGDSTRARLPILLADGSLARLESLVEGGQADEVGAMRARVALARSEIETDSFAAQRDLEVLANDLTQLAKRLGQR